jgi:hypothetical protein
MTWAKLIGILLFLYVSLLGAGAFFLAMRAPNGFKLLFVMGGFWSFWLAWKVWIRL